MMRAYRFAWWLIWSAIAAAAIAVACLAWSPVTAAATFVWTGVTTWCVAILLMRELGPCAPNPVEFRKSARIGVWGGVGALATLSLADSAEALAWPLLALATCTSPAAVQWVSRHARTASRRRTDGRLRLNLGAAVEERVWEQIVAGELARMSDRELCWAWRASYFALGEDPDVAWCWQVARVRQAYLAELEGRHPEQVAAWIATCPRPATGPERFLRTPANGETL